MAVTSLGLAVHLQLVVEDAGLLGDLAYRLDLGLLGDF
jgi:hypothetical protein